MCTVALALALALTAEPGFVSASPSSPEPDAPGAAPAQEPAPVSDPSAPSAGTIELVTGAPDAAVAPGRDTASSPAAASQALPAEANGGAPAVAPPLPAPAASVPMPAAAPQASSVSPATEALPAPPPPADPGVPVASVALKTGAAPGDVVSSAPQVPGLMLDASARVDLVDAKVVRAEAHLVVRLDASGRATNGTAPGARDPALVEGLLEAVNRAFGTVEQVAAGTLDESDVAEPETKDAAAPVAATHGAAPLPVAPPHSAGATAPASPVSAKGTGAGAPPGGASALPVETVTVNETGQTVRTVRDPNGAVIELLLDASGHVLSARLVSPTPSRM
jgi:hypothetical protein